MSGEARTENSHDDNPPVKIPEDLGTLEALEVFLREMIRVRRTDFFPDKDKRFCLVGFPNADAQRKALLFLFERMADQNPNAEIRDDEARKILRAIPVGKETISHLARPGPGYSAELAEAVREVEGDDSMRLLIFIPPWNSGSERVEWIPVRMVSADTETEKEPDSPEKMIRSIAEHDPKYFEMALLASMQVGCQGCHEEKDGLMICSGCRVARYCSPQCQKDGWTRGHGDMCAAMKTLRERVEGSGGK